MPNQSQNNVTLLNVVSINSGVDNKASSDSGLSINEDSSSSDSPKSEPVYYVADSNGTGNEKQAIAIIGSGNFGRALAMKMSKSGYQVNIGSRNPEKHRYMVSNI